MYMKGRGGEMWTYSEQVPDQAGDEHVVQLEVPIVQNILQRPSRAILAYQNETLFVQASADKPEKILVSDFSQLKYKS